MKALVSTKPDAMTYRDEPDPTLSPAEVLIRVDVLGIRGMDMPKGPRAFRDLDQGRATAAKIILRPQ